MQTYSRQNVCFCFFNLLFAQYQSASILVPKGQYQFASTLVAIVKNIGVITSINNCGDFRHKTVFFFIPFHCFQRNIFQIVNINPYSCWQPYYVVVWMPLHVFSLSISLNECTQEKRKLDPDILIFYSNILIPNNSAKKVWDTYSLSTRLSTFLVSASTP